MKLADRQKCTHYYEYDNVNPKNKFGGDCVIRAIANACGQSWEQTIREMTELGIKLGYVLNDSHVYEKYLLQKGFTQRSEPRDDNNKKMSVKEWIDDTRMFMKNKVIVANVGSHHATCIIDAKVHDIWNCSSQTMHKFWCKDK
jgi:hypothetical protein